MFELIFKIWFTMAVLPFLIFIEGTKMLGKFLKHKGIYDHWDIWHSGLVVAIILLIVLLMTGKTN